MSTRALFPKCKFDFSDIAASATETVVLHRELDVVGAGDGTLQLLVHGVTLSNGATLAIKLVSTAPSAEDPSLDFLGETVASVTIDENTSAPSLKVAGFAQDFGCGVQVRVVATQGSPQATMTADLSAQMVLKPQIPPKPTTDGDFTLDSASPRLTVGDGTGAPELRLDKAAGATASFDFADEGTKRWSVEADSSEDLHVRRYDSAGVLQDSATMTAADGNWSLPEKLALSGGAISDGYAGADDLVIGDGSGDAGMLLHIGTSGFARFAATDVAGSTRGQLRYYDPSGLWAIHLKGSDYYLFDAAALYPNADGARDLGQSGNRWQDVYSNTLDLSADATLNSASPTLTIGDGTGGGDALIINKAAASEYNFIWQDAGTQRYKWKHQSDERLFESFDSAGANALRVFTIYENVGGVANMVINESLLIASSGSALLDGKLAVDGAAIGHGNADARALVLGDGTANNGLTGYVGASRDFRINVNNGTNSEHGGIRYLGSSSPDEWVFRVENVDRMLISTTDVRPSGSMDLGVTGTRWGELFSDAATIGGNVDLDVASPILTVGDGTGNPVIILDKADATSGDGIKFDNAGTTRWKIRMGSDEDLAISRYDATPTLQDQTVWDSSTGDWTFPNDVQVANLELGSGNSMLRSGSGAPAAGLGSNGDFYFRTDGGGAAGGNNLYVKVGGSWGAIA